MHPRPAAVRLLACLALVLSAAVSGCAAQVAPQAAAHWRAAQAERAQGRLLEALAELDAALALAPDQPAFHAMRGDIEMQIGDEVDALADLGAAIRLYGDDKRTVEPLIQRASLLLRTDLGQARRDAEHAIALDPAAAQPHYTLAVLLSASDRPRALEEIGRSVALDPRLVHYREVRAMLRSGSFELAEALKEIDVDLARAPDDDMAWATRAEARLELGDVRAARDDARRALALRPSNVAAQFVEAFADVFLDELPAAAAILRELRARSPDALATRPAVAGTGPGDLLGRIAKDGSRQSRAQLALGMLGAARGDRLVADLHFTQAEEFDAALGPRVQQARALFAKD